EEGHDPTKEKAPGYKMGIRLRRGETKIGPGPAAYDVSRMTNMGKDICKAPKIGKADRFRQQLGMVSPGPAVYSRYLGDRSVYPRAPAFSVPHAKRGQIQTAIGPG
ncbi:outer dense fiber protein 3B-like, partial [Stegodyphus dumicola]|uniref:outer dense fiber protein 3B-like n=1 Tax=Stegodyphus dumicola TaxID=202533 RepID=UPI0015A980B9